MWTFPLFKWYENILLWPALDSEMNWSKTLCGFWSSGKCCERRTLANHCVDSVDSVNWVGLNCVNWTVNSMKWVCMVMSSEVPLLLWRKIIFITYFLHITGKKICISCQDLGKVHWILCFKDLRIGSRRGNSELMLEIVTTQKNTCTFDITWKQLSIFFILKDLYYFLKEYCVILRKNSAFLRTNFIIPGNELEVL